MIKRLTSRKRGSYRNRMSLSEILVFVVPVFAKMFADFGAALPVPTQIVVAMSNFVKHNIIYGVVFIFIAI